jgi:hypothetical protein
MVGTEGTSTPERDETAEDAIRAAMAEITGAGRRPYWLNVPQAAEKLLVAVGQGTITRPEAAARIKNAIATLSAQGELDAPIGPPPRDWKIKPKNIPPKNKIGFR